MNNIYAGTSRSSQERYVPTFIYVNENPIQYNASVNMEKTALCKMFPKCTGFMTYKKPWKIQTSFCFLVFMDRFAKYNDIPFLKNVKREIFGKN